MIHVSRPPAARAAPVRPDNIRLASGEPPGGANGVGEFEGYASLFGQPDLGRDVVMPGAFTASLRRRGAAGVRMLCPHLERE